MATSVIQVPGLRIKSVQRGIISTSSASATATITAVDVNKTVITKLGGYWSNAGNDSTWVTLTNSTTVTAYFGNNGGAGCNLSFEAIEYY